MATPGLLASPAPPTPGPDGTFSSSRRPLSGPWVRIRPHPTEPCPSRPSCHLPVPAGGGGSPPKSPRFLSAALTGARRRPRRGVGAPRPPLHRGGRRDGAGHRDAMQDQGGALCPGGGAPVPPDRTRSPRPGAPGPQGRPSRGGAAQERRRKAMEGGGGAYGAAKAGGAFDLVRFVQQPQVLARIVSAVSGSGPGQPGRDGAAAPRPPGRASPRRAPPGLGAAHRTAAPPRRSSH